jgi:cytochrome oxidase Cu insertion factor (SCO1/SenC/PrrC family)
MMNEMMTRQSAVAVLRHRAAFVFVVSGVLAAAGCADAAGRRFASQLKNKPAPEFELTALDGGKVRLSDYRGKPVVLAFFAFG